ncbi:hypothetical protein QOZ88_13160 [Blastococcus sp. BMG 814]|uniref:CHRD domain-containing protein n=1 Tax=Blastococcus carthaginiensis TaxID=3050034 RepID=A0ABT9IDF0_9ACTN|nr:hypothetical protein [Blastococcus carthaginiensis]MDP5183588.1 hypothetical protein [Blastococcus carthaginiensis]
MRKAFAIPSVAIAAAAFPLLTMSAASAAHDGSYQADLGSLNDSGVTGTGMVTLEGDQAIVTVEANGVLAGSPHAQHFHIGAQRRASARRRRPTRTATGSSPLPTASPSTGRSVRR